MTEIIVRSPLSLTLHWEQSQLIKLDLAWSKKGEKGRNPKSSYGQLLAETLEQYLEGRPVSWPEPQFHWKQCSEFAQGVLTALHRHVPWGRWLTYKELAVLCRAPKAARAVGMVMSRNPWPLLIPCHRVLGSHGALTGFGPGLKMKTYLLKLEGSWPLPR